MSIEIGDNCPSFELINTSGLKKKLEDYSRKLLVIYFYPKDNTPGCTRESCKFRDIYSEFKEFNCEVIGISADNNDSHKKFSKDFDCFALILYFNNIVNFLWTFCAHISRVISKLKKFWSYFVDSFISTLSR